GAVAPCPQLVHTDAVDVEADRVVVLAEFHCQRKSDIAQADDRDACTGWIRKRCLGHVVLHVQMNELIPIIRSDALPWRIEQGAQPRATWLSPLERAYAAHSRWPHGRARRTSRAVRTTPGDGRRLDMTSAT